MYAYLILPDGGAVEFEPANYDPAYGRYWYTYNVTGIYDPYGLKTTIDSEVVGNEKAHNTRDRTCRPLSPVDYDPNARRARITQVTGIHQRRREAKRAV